MDKQVAGIVKRVKNKYVKIKEASQLKAEVDKLISGEKKEFWVFSLWNNKNNNGRYSSKPWTEVGIDRVGINGNAKTFGKPNRLEISEYWLDANPDEDDRPEDEKEITWDLNEFGKTGFYNFGEGSNWSFWIVEEGAILTKIKAIILCNEMERSEDVKEK